MKDEDSNTKSYRRITIGKQREKHILGDKHPTAKHKSFRPLNITLNLISFCIFLRKNNQQNHPFAFFK